MFFFEKDPHLNAVEILKDPYLKTTSSVNLSPTQLPNIKILFKRDSSSRSRTGFSAVDYSGFTNTL